MNNQSNRFDRTPLAQSRIPYQIGKHPALIQVYHMRSQVSNFTKAEFLNPGNHADACCGWDGAAFAMLWLQSGEFVHGSR